MCWVDLGVPGYIVEVPPFTALRFFFKLPLHRYGLSHISCILCLTSSVISFARPFEYLQKPPRPPQTYWFTKEFHGLIEIPLQNSQWPNPRAHRNQGCVQSCHCSCVVKNHKHFDPNTSWIKGSSPERTFFTRQNLVPKRLQQNIQHHFCASFIIFLHIHKYSNPKEETFGCKVLRSQDYQFFWVWPPFPRIPLWPRHWGTGIPN